MGNSGGGWGVSEAVRTRCWPPASQLLTEIDPPAPGTELASKRGKQLPGALMLITGTFLGTAALPSEQGADLTEQTHRMLKMLGEGAAQPDTAGQVRADNKRGRGHNVELVKLKI